MALVKDHNMDEQKHTTVVCKLKHYAVQELARATKEHRSAIIPIELKAGVDYSLEVSDQQLADISSATEAGKSSIKLKLSLSQLSSMAPIELPLEDPMINVKRNIILDACMQSYSSYQS